MHRFHELIAKSFYVYEMSLLNRNIVALAGLTPSNRTFRFDESVIRQIEGVMEAAEREAYHWKEKFKTIRASAGR